MSNNKTAFITGSSSGIGEAIAKILLQKGYKVLLHGIEDEKEIEPKINELKKYGEVLSYYNFDIADADKIENFYKQLKSSNFDVDILVNNAGMQFVEEINNFPKNKWDQILAVNLSAAFHFMKLFLKDMQMKKWGRIINIASVHGLVASVNKSAYVASKHGLIGLTKVAALENAEKGITCNAICPGWVLTPLVKIQIEKIAIEKNISFDEAKQILLLEKQPSGNFVNPEDIGEMVSFLCTDAASQINGSAINIDGGWLAR